MSKYPITAQHDNKAVLDAIEKQIKAEASEKAKTNS